MPIDSFVCGGLCTETGDAIDEAGHAAMETDVEIGVCLLIC